VITCWLWDAGSACGVTDEEPRARKAAAACMRAGVADMARVEKALFAPGVGTLTMLHARTGIGWSAYRRNGRIRWKPLPAAGEPAVPGHGRGKAATSIPPVPEPATAGRRTAE
jgi:hypothetical protein